MDTYANFAELENAEKEGISFNINIRDQIDSIITIIAPHGGGIEPGTSEIAKIISGEDHSLALFEGMKDNGNRELHITSTNFDEPRCLALVQSSQNIIAIHGERSQSNVVYIGGKDIALGSSVRSALVTAGFQVKVHNDLNLQGKAPKNICNRGSSRKGVQLEIARGLRETFFESLTSEGRKRPTKRLEIFINAVRKGLNNAGKL